MRIYVAGLGIVALSALPAAADVSITSCGQSVPAHENAVLANDLACAAGPGTFGVSLGHRATLDLVGLTISGADAGVRCEGRKCLVTSTQDGGTVRDAETAGIAVVTEAGKLSVSNVALVDNLYALLADGETGKFEGHSLTISGSGIGIIGAKVKLAGLIASDNYRVVQARKTSLEDSTITATEDTAILGQLVKLWRSSVTGSGSGVDLMVHRRPRLLEESTCGASRVLSNPTETWGVCTND